MWGESHYANDWILALDRARRFHPIVWAPTASLLPSQVCRQHSGETGPCCKVPGSMSPWDMGVSHVGSITGWWNTPESCHTWQQDRQWQSLLTHLVTAPHLFFLLPTQIHTKCPRRCFDLRTKIKEKGSGLEMHLMPSWGSVCVFMSFGEMSLCFEVFLCNRKWNIDEGCA